MEALFLVHEGYLGAMGTFLRSAFGDDVVKVPTTLTNTSQC
jgi:pantothenate kinase